jgi:PPOX class probable F420-dependent enzyme
VDAETRRLVLDLLSTHGVMSLATVRPDGWPQATAVVYANDGLTLYFACDRESQKARNIARSPRVSLTVNRDYDDWNEIRGLSMGARAEVLSRPADLRRAWRALGAKFPAMADMTEDERAQAAVVRVRPTVISVIDYRRGFGHTDLVTLEREPRPASGQRRSAGVRGVSTRSAKARQRASGSFPPRRRTQRATRSSPSA